MATREEMIAFIKAKQQASAAPQSSKPTREQMIQFIKNKQSEAPQIQQKKEYDYSNVGQVASDLGEKAVKGLKEAPEAVGSAVGQTIAGPLGSGVGAIIGKSVSEAAKGIVEAVKDPQSFIQDLSRLPTKEQVIEQVNDYLKTFGINVAAPAIVSKIGQAASKVTGQGVKEAASEMAEKATGATAVQAEKFKTGAGRELLDRGVVKFADTPKKVAERSQALIDKANQEIDTALKTLDKKDVKVSVENVLEKIQAQAASLSKDPSKVSIVKKLNSIVDDVVNTGESFIKPSEAEQTKRGFNQIAKNWLDPETGQAGKIAYRAYRDAVEETATKADPELAKMFKEAKQTYGLMAPIEEAASRRAQQLKQSPVGGLLDTAAAGVGGAAIGGVTGLISGVAIAGARKAVAPRLASSGAVTLNEVSKILEKTPQYTKLLRDNPAAFFQLTKAVHESFKNEPLKQETQPKNFPKVVRKNGQKAIVRNQDELDEAMSEGWR